MKKLALIALLLCTGLVVGCGDKGTGSTGSPGAAPASTGSAS